MYDYAEGRFHMKMSLHDATLLREALDHSGQWYVENHPEHEIRQWDNLYSRILKVQANLASMAAAERQLQEVNDETH